MSRPGAADPPARDRSLVSAAVLAVLVSVALAWTAHVGAIALLVAIALLQTLLAIAWVFGLRAPGRAGALIIAGLSAASADIAVSLWPHSRLGCLLAAFGLAVPVLFVHQLLRGAGRGRVLESLGSTAVLVLAETAVAALLQVRHEFPPGRLGNDVTLAVVVVLGTALFAGCALDLVLATPRFDVQVPRGLPGALASVLAGALVGVLALHHAARFDGVRGLFLGAVLGALAALLAVALAFAVAAPGGGALSGPHRSWAAPTRSLLEVLIPFCVLAPVALLICLSIHA